MEHLHARCAVGGSEERGVEGEGRRGDRGEQALGMTSNLLDAFCWLCLETLVTAMHENCM